LVKIKICFFQKYKKIIITIAILIALPLIYSMIGTRPDNNSNQLLSSSNNQFAQQQIIGNEIIAALNQVQTLSLSKDIFEDPVFRSLIDRSSPIPLEPVGKINPFAPIGQQIIRNTTTPTATSTRPAVNTNINTIQNRPVTEQPVI
jgi:hypothetical protein